MKKLVLNITQTCTNLLTAQVSANASVVAKTFFKRVARKKMTNRRELFFHLQNGTSWSTVLSAADVAELCRRVLKM